MRSAPSEEIIAPFVARGFNEANAKILQRICKSWNTRERKDKELRVVEMASSATITSG